MAPDEPSLDGLSAKMDMVLDSLKEIKGFMAEAFTRLNMCEAELGIMRERERWRDLTAKTRPHWAHVLVAVSIAALTYLIGRGGLPH